MSDAFAAMRPNDWWVLDLPADPVPGDPDAVRHAAREYLRLAEDAETANRQVRELAGDPAVLAWVGAAATVFADQIADLPRDLHKLAISYQLAGDALVGYAPRLDEAQVQADRALANGRVARRALAAAKCLEDSAHERVKAAEAELRWLWSTPLSGMTPERLDAAVRTAELAKSRLAAAARECHQAQADLDAARRLALQAAGVRDVAANRCAQEIAAASDAGIKNKPWWSWQKVSRTVGIAWSTTVQACKVVGTVVCVAALVVGGPVILWAIAATATVVLLNTLARFAEGTGTFGDVVTALIDLIPGGRLAKHAPMGGRAIRRLSRVERMGVWRAEEIRFAAKASIGESKRPESPGSEETARRCLSRMTAQVHAASALAAPAR